MRRNSVASMGPSPSMGLPTGSMTRPRTASPTGTWAIRPVRSDDVAFFDVRVITHDGDTDIVLFEIQG